MMATKNNPGAWDCYGNAKPDEPMFILLARDVAAPQAIRAWCLERFRLGKNNSDDPQILEALACADEMEEYRRNKKPQ